MPSMRNPFSLLLPWTVAVDCRKDSDPPTSTLLRTTLGITRATDHTSMRFGRLSSTAPDESVTVPPIAPTPCANAGSVEHAHNADATTILTKRDAVIVIPSCQRGFVGTARFEREHTPRLMISLQSFALPACMLTPFR